MDMRDKKREKELADNETVRRIMSRYAEMKEVRRHIDPLYEDIVRNLYPVRAGWHFEKDAMLTAASEIFDGEPLAALARLKNGLFAWLVNPSLDWLNFSPVDKKLENNKIVTEFLQKLKLRLYEMFSASNFYEAVAEDIGDCAALGTNASYVDWDDENKRLVFSTFHLRGVFISEDRFGNVDTLYHEFEMSNRNVLEQFGDAIPEAKRAQMEKKPDEMARVLHAMEPRLNYLKTRTSVKKRMPFRSAYVLLSTTSSGDEPTTGILLEDGGMKYKRFNVWRFERIPGTPFGYCPGMASLFDTKMMHLMSKTMADAAQLAAAPPMQGPESMKGKIKIAPRGISYYNEDGELKPIMTSISYPLGIDSQERRGKIVREHFYNDYFMSASQIQGGSRERTRTEIMKLDSESAAALGTILGRIQTEKLDPTIRLAIIIGSEKGLLPEPPTELGEDFEFKVQYMGPLMQSQRKFVNVQGITSGLKAMGEMMNFDPLQSYNVRLNEATRRIMLEVGFPADLLEDDKTVRESQAATRQAQAQAQAEQAKNERLLAEGRATRAPEPGSPGQEEITKRGGQGNGVNFGL